MPDEQGTGGGVWNLSALVTGTGLQVPAGPSAAEPVAQEPVAQEPVAQEPVAQEPVALIAPVPGVPLPVPPPPVPPSAEPASPQPLLPEAVSTAPAAASAPLFPPPAPGRLGSIRPGSRTTVGLAVALAAALILVVGVVAVVIRGGNPSPAAGPPPPVPVSTDTAQVTDEPSPTPNPSDSPSDSPSPSPTVDSQAAALQQLQQLRDADVASVVFQGQYAAQLASKNVGIVDRSQTAADGTHTFQATDILAEHQSLRQADNLGARVVLLLSTDYGRRQLYQGQPLWVTFALGDFTSAAAVQQWCARRFPDLSGALLDDHCTPRRLEPASG